MTKRINREHGTSKEAFINASGLNNIPDCPDHKGECEQLVDALLTKYIHLTKKEEKKEKKKEKGK